VISTLLDVVKGRCEAPFFMNISLGHVAC
jgi:hypothetical protein